MATPTFIQLVLQVGFNGALVVLLLFMGKTFLDKMLNHWGDIHKEMKEHTLILGRILEATTGKK